MSMVEKLFSLVGKRALVTGGSSGIGRMIGTALMHAGAHVTITSRREERSAAAAKELNALGTAGAAEGIGGDLRSEEGTAMLVAALQKRTDTLDILINNAGASWSERLESFPYQAWARVLNLNVVGL